MPNKLLLYMTFLDFGNQTDDRKPVYTRSGTAIKQLELNEYQKQRGWQTFDHVRRRTEIVLKNMADNNRMILKVRSLSPHMYNCVGMIFSSRRAWIEIDELQQILNDDNYGKISLEQLDTGDIVIYTKNSVRRHIGLVTHIERERNEIRNIVVLSKWGADGEIEHYLNAVPKGYGDPTEFWSEKVSDVIR